MKELHIHFWNDNVEYLLVTDMFSIITVINNNETIINTTCSHSVHLSYWTNKYKLFIHPVVGDMFEIVIRTSETHTNREIKDGHNIEKMLLSVEFDKDGTSCF